MTQFLSEQVARTIHSINQVELVAQPESPDVSHHAEDGVYIKQLFFPRAGVFMGKHVHDYSHAHMVALGEVRLWVDGVERGDYKQGDCIHVEAGKEHVIMSLTMAIGYCIHRERPE